ncbi:hypothetical protein P4493_05075 [Bacillus thuringiensis]|jgi:hypothetical protein|uniref:Membrane protein n=3 Tax=Bacillus thuringiensis TaxID=1428 RepID=A0A0B5NQ27_BACTU|nr:MULTISPECIES: hypothetical protein [Bacillus]MEC2535602.1 hypothetical protein [Bacillus cereus]MED1153633.1 hypothetical protein [Bacillus paranthracis]OUB09481.1 hypothetical protein BK708_33745 [Bacillus thuringiensis serovar yunnanensis]AFQ29958.1 hypothetical protein BTF1_29287 [Bacillus thuringiensis HD-789]AJG74168.1 putative membrane protein [Bacillus thuringiensis]
MKKIEVVSAVCFFLVVVVSNLLLEALFDNLELSIVISVALGILVYYGFDMKNKEVTTQDG